MRLSISRSWGAGSSKRVIGMRVRARVASPSAAAMLLAQLGQVVVGHVGGGLGTHHETVLISRESREDLVTRRIAAEQALGLAGFHVAQVQEGPVALVGGAAAPEVDRISVLVQHPAAIGQGAS